MNSAGFMMNQTVGLCCCTGKVKLYANLINSDKISELKKSGKDNEEFISTNDIITSQYGNAIKARLLSIAVNFRKKVDDIPDNLAGN